MPTKVTNFNAMIQETHYHAAGASERAPVRNKAGVMEDKHPPSFMAQERATKQQEQTCQYFFAKLPEEKPEGGKGEDRDPLSIHLAQGAQPLGTMGQQVSQDLYATSYPQGPGKTTEGALHSMNKWADANLHHTRQVGASLLHLSNSPLKHASLEKGFLTDDKSTCQRRDCTRADRGELRETMGSGFSGAMDTLMANWRPLCGNKSLANVLPERIRDDHGENSSMRLCDKLVSIWRRRWGSGCLVEGNTLRSSGGNEGRDKRSSSLWICRMLLLISLAISWTDLRVMMFADAVFAPRTRTELQGDGGSALGVFGCVGSCGGSLSTSSGSTYCSPSSNGPWESGSGNPCNNANSGVPSGQGTGKYGTMGSWDVSSVDNMRYSKLVTSFYSFLSMRALVV